MNEQTFVG